MLLLHDRLAVSAVARPLQASRKSIREWRARYLRFSEAGMVPQERGRQATTVTEELCAKVLELLERQPLEQNIE